MENRIRYATLIREALKARKAGNRKRCDELAQEAEILFKKISA